MPLILLLGGARSGKSSLAVDVARRGGAPVTFIATAEGRDGEMRERIARHRAERPPEWTTLAAPVHLDEAIAAVDDGACLIIDCLSLWLANLLERDSRDALEAQGSRAAAMAAARRGLTIAVSNEVGMGVVPSTRLGRDYRDALGRLNAAWAAAAETGFLVVAGQALRLAPARDVLPNG